MKRLLPIAFFVLLFCQLLAAKPVDRQTAARVAHTFMSHHGFNATLSDVTPQTSFSRFYIFASDEGGFVLVSADDCAAPILAFSTVSRFDAKQIPVNVQGVLEMYDEEILLLSGSPCAAGWQELLSGSLPPEPLLTAVAPLLSTQWDQSPYYNNLCPYDNTYHQRTVTGCVATATAQIMKKWNHPATGYGSHSYSATNDHTSYGTLSANFGATTYQWSSMPTALSGTSSSTQVSAVATLMYHIGIADEMEYDIADHGGSGASNINNTGLLDASTETSLQQYFKYRSDMAVICREDYSDAVWVEKLKAELDAGRPILFSGRDADGGHSFVCDGYNNSSQFHINWGWGGAYDGYFTMGALNPDGGGTGSNAGTYNMRNSALIGIQPNNSWSSTGSTTVTVTSGTGGTASGGGNYSFGSTVELSATANAGYRFDGWSDGSKFNPRQCVANGGTLAFTAQFAPLAGDTVTYCPGNHNITSFGATDGLTYWGIRLPSSALTAGDTLYAVSFYAGDIGSYSLKVYSGSSAPVTLLYSGSVNAVDEGWMTIQLNSVVTVPSNDLWVTFSSSADYPAAVTYGCGNGYGRLWGSTFVDMGYQQFTFMIKAIFAPTSGSAPQPPVDDCMVTVFPFTESFKGSYSCWSLIDANSDGNSWSVINSIGSDATAVTPHTGTHMAASFSWATDPYNADDYLVSPAIQVPSGYTTLSWWFRVNGGYPEDKLAVKLSTTGNDAASFTTTLIDITPTSANGSWTNQTVDLSDYAGQTVYLAFHHHDSYDQNYLVLDDIVITNSTDPPAPTQYTVTVQSNNSAWGTVSGGGTYDEGSTVTISATANQGYHFVQWNDGNSNATRTVTVTANVTYIATFEADPQPEAIEEVLTEGWNIYPNPASSTVTLVGIDNAELTVTDMTGRTVLSFTGSSLDVSHLSPGAYFVRITRSGATRTGATRSATTALRKLIVTR